MSPEEALAQIAAETARCTRCRLHRTRGQAVPGEGAPTARLMLIGEAPGRREDQLGRPFAGRSGQVLTQLLTEAGLRREEVWIGNVIKCRPPENRDPRPDELAACRGFLDRQIAALDPALILTLGRFSLGVFFPGERISQVHGELRRAGGRFVVPMFHPAAGLYNPQYRRLLEADFARLPQQLKQALGSAAAR